MTTARLVCTKSFHFKIPGHSDYSANIVKSTIVNFLREMKVFLPVELVRFYRYKFAVWRTKGRKLGDISFNHITISKYLRNQDLTSLTEERKNMYEKRCDVKKFMLDFDVNIGHDARQLQRIAENQFQKWLNHGQHQNNQNCFYVPTWHSP